MLCCCLLLSRCAWCAVLQPCCCLCPSSCVCVPCSWWVCCASHLVTSLCMLPLLGKSCCVASHVAVRRKNRLPQPLACPSPPSACACHSRPSQAVSALIARLVSQARSITLPPTPLPAAQRNLRLVPLQMEGSPSHPWVAPARTGASETTAQQGGGCSHRRWAAQRRHAAACGRDAHASSGGLRHRRGHQEGS